MMRLSPRPSSQRAVRDTTRALARVHAYRRRTRCVQDVAADAVAMTDRLLFLVLLAFGAYLAIVVMSG
jgi:hypothetical protein